MRNYLIEDLPQYFEDYKKSIKNPKNSGIKLQIKTSCGIRDGARLLSTT